jgi:NAD(P)-dependent dehydrogenase (short-subunit alcohol dehydrogenase family)
LTAERRIGILASLSDHSDQSSHGDLFAAASEDVQAELSVAGRVILVTGGGAGLGRTAALLLAGRGARVAVADVRPDRIAETVAAAGRAGQELVGVVVDVADPAQVQRAIDATVEAHGRLDVMVNAAGVIHVVPFLEVTPEQYRRLMAVNVDGTFFGTQLAARQMVKQGRGPDGLAGRIVNVTSPSAEGNSDSQMAYAMSKAAVNRVTGGAAVALYRQHGIMVAALKPYGVPSPMLRGIFEQRAEARGVESVVPARDRARQLVHGRFESLETHALVLAWMCAAPPESVNGTYVTSVPHAAPL